MPGLRGTPAVTMHDVGALDRRIVVERRRSATSKPSTGEDCGDIERLALRDALGDVEQHDVAEFLQADQWASVPPICPAPMSAIFLRAIGCLPLR